MQDDHPSDTVIDRAREVWPEAEGFERAPGGWTFRIGAGWTWLTDGGHVSPDPEGSRGHARRRLMDSQS